MGVTKIAGVGAFPDLPPRCLRRFVPLRSGGTSTALTSASSSSPGPTLTDRADPAAAVRDLRGAILGMGWQFQIGPQGLARINSRGQYLRNNR